MTSILAVDTETTGIDLKHGCRAFAVTTSTSVIDKSQDYWEWYVDPYTRKPEVAESDLEDVWDKLESAELLVFQNAKFDIAALDYLFDGDFVPNLDWSRVRDTLISAHLLASNQPKDLTTLALVYLGVNVKPYDNDLETACKQARDWAKHNRPDWLIAKKGLPQLPSAKDKVWKNDTWLPRLVAQKEDYPSDHPWWDVLSDYANMDSQCTVKIYERHMELIKEKGLDHIYEERCKIPRVVYGMESKGITANRSRFRALTNEYRDQSEEAERICCTIAGMYGAELSMPKSGSNKSLQSACFEHIGLPVVAKSPKTGLPLLNKDVLSVYEFTLDDPSPQLDFVRALGNKRKRDTALSYMESYERFWLPLRRPNGPWVVLHPSLNPTGTATTRWSSSNPNEQNISKKEGFNLRQGFGPALGREWWSCDAKNIELRLPAYESGEPAMIEIFEKPDEPPYYGSYHILIFSILHPDKFKKHGADCKKEYASTWYQWTKNGNFADQYGAVAKEDGTGTADRAYHVPGAQKIIADRLTEKAKLNQKWVDFANRYGYVETIPDRTVDPERGYPLYCTRTRWGGVKPTIPLNYHVQGSAMWWMCKAMVRVQEMLDDLNRKKGSRGYYMVMQVHDELVFDFPKGSGTEPWKTNLPIMKEVMKIMELGGDDFGIPTPVSCEYHEHNWAEGLGL